MDFDPGLINDIEIAIVFNGFLLPYNTSDGNI